MSIDPTLFRKVMRRFATGVTILTVRDGDQIHGMTANALTSVSLGPTLVLVCITKTNTTHGFVSRAGHYALNILGEYQENLAKRFAHQVDAPMDPFVDVPFHVAATGAPILDDCIAYLDCHVVAAHEAGDHTIFIGEVLAAGSGKRADDDPLLYLDGHYATLDKREESTLLLPAHSIEP